MGVHGRHTGVLVDATDLSPYLNAGDANKTQDTHDVTPYGVDDKVYIGGHEDGALTLGGFYDGEPDAVDDILSGLFGEGSEPVVTWCPGYGHGGLGHVAVLMQPTVSSYGITAPVAGAVEIAITAQGGSVSGGGVRLGGRIVWPLSTIDDTADGDYIDDGDDTAFGGVAHLHVLDFDGTDIDIRLQHTADDPDDNPVWVDLVAWEGVDGAGVVRSHPTGTVERYLRVVVDGGTFTDCTFAVAFARHRR